MAAGGEEKTEEPTAKKKSDARKRGNIAKSRDMTAALELLAAIYTLRYIGPAMGGRMGRFMERMLEHDMPKLAIPVGKEILPYAMDWGGQMFIMLLPFLALACVAAYVANCFQVGFLVSFEQVKLNPGKLNPVAGLKRVFSARNLVALAMNMAKLSLVLAVSWWVMTMEFRNVFSLLEMETRGTLLYITDRTLDLARNLALILLALGIGDYCYQKHKHHNDLKMTKQEVKEEFKQSEGDPQVKSKIRQKQREAAIKRMMHEVPQAEVVVRNPTHYAVAISYKPGMEAPVVVAKGKDKVAERIIEAAREARVPMVENPPLARQLYKMVEVGDPIPEELFKTVAEVLAQVMDNEKKMRFKEALAA